MIEEEPELTDDQVCELLDLMFHITPAAKRFDDAKIKGLLVDEWSGINFRLSHDGES